MIQAWLGFLETKSKDDKLVRWGGEWDFLGDWPGAKGVNGDTRERCASTTAIDLQPADCGENRRRPRQSGRGVAYRQRADTVRRAVHAEFFPTRPEELRERIPGLPRHRPVGRSAAGGAASGGLGEAQNQEIAKRNGHIWVGITGGRW